MKIVYFILSICITYIAKSSQVVFIEITTDEKDLFFKLSRVNVLLKFFG